MIHQVLAAARCLSSLWPIRESGKDCGGSINATAAMQGVQIDIQIIMPHISDHNDQIQTFRTPLVCAPGPVY